MKRSEAVAERRKQIPKLYRSIYDRAVAGKSRKACINAQCLECVGRLRTEITECTDIACPLWTVRPYQTSPEAD